MRRAMYVGRVDRAELQVLLDEHGVHPNAYRLDGAAGEDMLTLSVTRDGAVVFYSERGRRGEEWTFDTEDEACRHLADLLLRDESNRFQLVAGPSVTRSPDELLDKWLRAHKLRREDLLPEAVRMERIPWERGVSAARVFVRRTFLRDRGLPLDGC